MPLNFEVAAGSRLPADSSHTAAKAGSAVRLVFRAARTPGVRIAGL
ncbi:MAG TPA: hypothetical protein PLV92_10580 [Pirellulaceae bacterium]|nr:hypothetical protein [Pirellulaceae bacterium]